MKVYTPFVLNAKTFYPTGGPGFPVGNLPVFFSQKDAQAAIPLNLPAGAVYGVAEVNVACNKIQAPEQADKPNTAPISFYNIDTMHCAIPTAECGTVKVVVHQDGTDRLNLTSLYNTIQALHNNPDKAPAAIKETTLAQANVPGIAIQFPDMDKMQNYASSPVSPMMARMQSEFVSQMEPLGYIPKDVIDEFVRVSAIYYMRDSSTVEGERVSHAIQETALRMAKTTPTVNACAAFEQGYHQYKNMESTVLNTLERNGGHAELIDVASYNLRDDTAKQLRDEFNATLSGTDNSVSARYQALAIAAQTVASQNPSHPDASTLHQISQSALEQVECLDGGANDLGDDEQGDEIDEP